MKISWWKWLPFQAWRSVGLAESADEIPERLPRKGAVLVGSADLLKWVAFDCPCRRGHRIMVNTDTSRQPAWRVAPGSERRLTITPSIDYFGDSRRCHYSIRDGKTVWAEDSDR